jgi:hypothetical protein
MSFFVVREQNISDIYNYVKDLMDAGSSSARPLMAPYSVKWNNWFSAQSFSSARVAA